MGPRERNGRAHAFDGALFASRELLDVCLDLREIHPSVARFPLEPDLVMVVLDVVEHRPMVDQSRVDVGREYALAERTLFVLGHTERTRWGYEMRCATKGFGSSTPKAPMYSTFCGGPGRGAHLSVYSTTFCDSVHQNSTYENATLRSGWVSRGHEPFPARERLNL
jgi:hypothetical protein